jgi:hypothetical protein
MNPESIRGGREERKGGRKREGKKNTGNRERKREKRLAK